MKSIFCKNLIKLRKARGLSQQQLAEMTGLTKRQISYYEKELTDSILNNIELIAKALNVETSVLFEDNNNNESNKIKNDLSQIDSRTFKKINMILSLPRNERHIIYNIVDSFIAKRKLKK